jgi:hypothetical protein
MLSDSFKCCGNTSRDQSHSALAQILSSKTVINDYVTNYHEAKDYDSFDSISDPTIEDDDNLPNEIFEDESDSDGSDYEQDSSSSSSSSDASDDDDEDMIEEDDSVENTATPGQNQNKENKTPMLRSQRQKALRESKLNTRQQYEIPTTTSSTIKRHRM